MRSSRMLLGSFGVLGAVPVFLRQLAHGLQWYSDEYNRLTQGLDQGVDGFAGK